MSAWSYGSADLGQVQAHRCRVAAGQNEPRTFAMPGTDGAEEVGGSGALIARRRRPCASLGPAPGNLVLLPNPGLITEPDLYVGRSDAFLTRNFVQDGGETFLKCSIAPSTCA